MFLGIAVAASTVGLALAPSLAIPRPSLIGEPSPPQLLNRGDIFNPDDYPTEAKASLAEGRVKVRALISPGGGVIACDMMVSAGTAALDKRTCDLLRQRGWFLPARDASGKFISGSTVVSVQWLLKDTNYGSSASFSRLTLPITATGKAESCSFEVFWAGKRTTVEDCLGDPEVHATAANWSNMKWMRGGTLFSEMHLTSSNAKPRPGEEEDDQPLGRTVAKVEIDREGKALACRIVEDDVEGSMNPCANVNAKTLTLGPPPKGLANPAVRLIMVVYFRQTKREAQR